MEFTAYTFLAPKEGEEPDDCQDSIHPLPGESSDGTFAVSDGTTTSFFSRLWAQILTRRFSKNSDAAFTNWSDWLTEAQDEWQTEVKRRAVARDASFFTRNDVLSKKPAAATFVGLVLDPPNEGGTPWKALVLGDSCLFLLGADGKPRSIELTKPDDFNSLVKTAESYKEPSHFPKPFGSTSDGTEPEITAGDVILLATDALSKWLLSRQECASPVWGTVLQLNRDSEFTNFIADARCESKNPLENDDVALVVLKFGEPHTVYSGLLFEPHPTAVTVLTKQNENAICELPPREERAINDPDFDSPMPHRASSLSVVRRAKHNLGTLVAFVSLGALSLAGVSYLSVLLGHTRNQVRDLQNEVTRLNVEKDEESKLTKQQQQNLDEKTTQLKKLTSTNATLEQRIKELGESKKALSNRLAEAEERLKDSKPAEPDKQLSESKPGVPPISPVPAKQ